MLSKSTYLTDLLVENFKFSMEITGSYASYPGVTMAHSGVVCKGILYLLRPLLRFASWVGGSMNSPFKKTARKITEQVCIATGLF